MSDPSMLGDLIVMHGPYVAYELIPNQVARYLESDELNALRDELIRLRHIAIAVELLRESIDDPANGGSA